MNEFTFEKNRQSISPLISVIIPVFNEQLLLKESIYFYTPEFKTKFSLELIISDGGSTDQTIEIAKQFADKIVLHNENRKQTIAEGRNKGAEIALGKILVFINGDTIPKEPEYFFKYVYSLAGDDYRFSNFIALACTVTADPQDILLIDKIFYFLHNHYVRILNLIGLGMGRGECQIINADRFREVNGNNIKLIAGEDFDLYRRLAAKGKISFEKKLVVYESLRRFRKFGYAKVLWHWLINSISVMITNKSISKEWDAVR